MLISHVCCHSHCYSRYCSDRVNLNYFYVNLFIIIGIQHHPLFKIRILELLVVDGGSDDDGFIHGDGGDENVACVRELELMD